MLMTEKDAERMPCIGNENCGRVVSATYGTAAGLDAASFGCRSTSRRFCQGSLCPAWWWGDDETEFTTTDNVQREQNAVTYLSEPRRPTGDGWGPLGKPERAGGSPRITQRWRRDRQNRRGYCGLAPERTEG